MNRKVNAENVNSILFNHKPTDYVVQHTHKFSELIYYLNGKGLSTVYNVNADNFKFSGDTILIVPPGVKHDEFYATKSSIVCNFIDMPEDDLNKTFFIKKNKSNVEVFNSIKRQMLSLHNFFELYEKKKNEKYKSKIESLIFKLSISVSEITFKYNKSEDYERLVCLVKEYIRKNFLRKISEYEFTEKFFYSYDRLRHIFTKYAGISINDYQQSLKLNHAKNLLMSTDSRLNKIASLCGFENDILFSIWFNNLVGCSPGRYRMINRKPKYGVVVNMLELSERNFYNMIIDTDLCCDCDDAAAIAIANAYHSWGYINLLCITHSLTNIDAVRCVDFIDRFYGNDIELGIAKKSLINAEKYTCRFVDKLKDEFDKAKEIYDATDLIKKKLLSAKDDSVIFLCIGQLNNLADFIEDDENLILLRKKVHEIVIMGGNFMQAGEYYVYSGEKYYGEFNIVSDIESAQKVVKHKNLPLIFIDFNQGAKVLTGESLLQYPNSPVARIYKHYGFVKRESWDIIAALYAICGGGSMFSYSKKGFVNVDDKGKTTFIEGGGEHILLQLNKPEVIEEQIEEILNNINKL